MPCRNRSQSLPVPKCPTFFSLPRQLPLMINRDPAKHKGGIERPSISHPIPMAPRLGAPHPKNIPIPQQNTASVSPHTSAWIQVADEVVGRHPLGKPLVTRVATPAEIALISGHVHIPWAYPHLKKTHPTPIRIQRPTANYAPLSIMPLEDVRNTQGRHIWRAVNNHAKLFKGKGLRHSRRKENIL